MWRGRFSEKDAIGFFVVFIFSIVAQSCQAVTTSPAVVDEASWIAALDVADRHCMLIQRMTKEYLLIVIGSDPIENAARLEVSMTEFNVSLMTLLNNDGDQDPVIPSSFTSFFASELEAVAETWRHFAPLLENPSTAVTKEHLEAVVAGSDDMMESSSRILFSCFEVGNVEISTLQLQFAARQRTLLQTMAVQATLIGANVLLEVSAAKLEETRVTFAESHVSLLRGILTVGLPQTQNMCSLHAMTTVSHEWELYEPLVERIGYEKSASQDDIQDLTNMTDNLEVSIQEAFDQYASDSDSCVITPTHLQWTNILNSAGRQRMLVQWMSRLFFQIIREIHVETSVVTFTSVKVLGEESVRLLIEGNLDLNIPVPPTQNITDTLLLLWDVWEEFNEDTTTYITEPDIDLATIEKIAVDSADCLDLANSVTEMYVSRAVSYEPSVAAHVINLSGRQRMLIQKMGKEAVLMSLGVDVSGDVGDLNLSTQLFTHTHASLLEGNMNLGLQATTDHCIIQQMQSVWDLYTSYEILVKNAGLETIKTSVAVLQAIDDEATPLISAMDLAVSFYAAGAGHCTRTYTDVEWQELIAEVSHLGEWSQKLAKELCLISRDIDLSVNMVRLANTTQHFSELLLKVKFGSTPDSLPAPPTEAVLKQIFDVSELWTSFRALIDTDIHSAAEAADIVNDVLSLGESLLVSADDLVSLYVDAAWENNENVNGTRILSAARQLTLIEKMTKEVVCLGFSNITGAGISGTVAEYETMKEYLLTGFTGSERKYDIKAADEETILAQMATVSIAWDALKPLITSIANEEDGWSDSQHLEDVVSASDQLLTAMDIAVTLYKQSGVDTRIQVKILSPMSFTGSELFGPTLLMSQMVALDIINNEQILLPGHVLTNHTFDDKCDGDFGQMSFLSSMASGNEWIALGGISCSEVCESTAGITDALRLPFISYECASSEILSDSDVYPAFTRMGTALLLAPSAIVHMSSWAGWDHITVASEPSTDGLQYRERIRALLEEGGLTTSATSSSASEFENMKTMMLSLEADKKRVVLVLGDETYYRTLLCAAKVTEVLPGMTWLSIHSFRRSWWTQDDADLMATAPTCTGEALSELFQGAVNVAGLGVSLDADRDKRLTCFPEHTSRTMSELISMHLSEGYPAGYGNAVESPYTNIQSYGADGVCMIALTVKEMMSRGYTLDQLILQEETTYNEMVYFMKTNLSFEGVSGLVQFSGNERRSYLAITQVRDHESIPVGYLLSDDADSVTIDYAILTSNFWVPAPGDEGPVSTIKTWHLVLIGIIVGTCLVVTPVCATIWCVARKCTSRQPPIPHAEKT